VKGVIFNLVEDVVRREHGDDFWDDVVDGSGVSGAYTSLGTYSDAELTSLAARVGEQLRAEPADVVRHVGREGLSMLAERYPEFFTPHTDVRSFLLSLNTVVHPEVRRLFPGAVIPDFEHRLPAPDVLELIYSTERGRCDLAEGLILGAADHYGQHVELDQPQCTRRGDPVCVLRVRTR
jgi:Haem-NO-binding